MGKTHFYVDTMALHQEVTGSCIMNIIKFPDGNTKKILVDCGLFQELEYTELNSNLPFNAEDIDYVLVTHNHVDHTGRLPLLVKSGYNGNIHTSKTTSKLLPYALGDSYKVLRTRAKIANEPQLYTDTDVDKTLSLVKAHNYEESFWLDKNIRVTFFMNGHLPGAVIILLQITFKDLEYSSSGLPFEDINILFTGDYNSKNMFFDVKPLPSWVFKLPLTIVQESTYGDMDSLHVKRIFEKNVLKALDEGKEVVVPVFSLGRSQEMMYILKGWQKQNKLSTDIPIYFDGNLGIKYTSLYLKDGLDNKEECKDFLPENITFVSSSEMRSNIMQNGQPKIILTTSGMGSYGPAQTYLPAYVKRNNALIHFTGYCSEGTLGRRLKYCMVGDTVEISGLQVKKLAKVEFTNEFSAHAKSDELIDFLKPFENIKLLLINHGETETKQTYANKVIDEIDPKDVGILSRDYFFRLDGYGFVKSFTTKF